MARCGDYDWVAQHGPMPECGWSSRCRHRGTIKYGWAAALELDDRPVRHARPNIVPPRQLEELLGRAGIDNRTTIVRYGDNNNWFAAGMWQLKVWTCGRPPGRRAEEMDGRGRVTTARRFPVDRPAPDLSLRVSEVQQAMKTKSALVDVRSAGVPGEILAPPGLRTCQRGHIPDAKNIRGRRLQ
jgi:3-mercaptopyruvate sulfurtransferase SseA